MNIFYRVRKAAVVAVSMVLVLLSGNAAFAQSQAFSFTQYMDNLTPFNPAYSLLDKAASINTLARKQLIGIDGAPTSLLINGNVPLESINGSLGLIIFNDQLAIEHQTEVNAYLGKSIQLGVDGFLAVSINAGLRNYIANYSQLDSNDPSFRNDVRETKPNLGFGVMYYTDTYYIGISAPELTITSLGTASVQNGNNFRSHYYLAAALIADAGEDIKFKPATLISYAKDVPVIADISGTFYFKEILGLGANYRTTKQAAGIISVNVDAIHIGYSYQFGTSSGNLGGFNNAIHEVSLSYRFGKGAAVHKLL